MLKFTTENTKVYHRDTETFTTENTKVYHRDTETFTTENTKVYHRDTEIFGEIIDKIAIFSVSLWQSLCPLW